MEILCFPEPLCACRMAPGLLHPATSMLDIHQLGTVLLAQSVHHFEVAGVETAVTKAEHRVTVDGMLLYVRETTGGPWTQRPPAHGPLVPALHTGRVSN